MGLNQPSSVWGGPSCMGLAWFGSLDFQATSNCHNVMSYVKLFVVLQVSPKTWQCRRYSMKTKHIKKYSDPYSRSCWFHSHSASIAVFALSDSCHHWCFFSIYPPVIKQSNGQFRHLQLIFPAINLHSKWISHQSWRWDDGSHGTHLIKRKSLDSRML